MDYSPNQAIMGETRIFVDNFIPFVDKGRALYRIFEKYSKYGSLAHFGTVVEMKPV